MKEERDVPALRRDKIRGFWGEESDNYDNPKT